MINFPAVEQSVRDLKRQLNKGDIDDETFEKELLDLIDVAEDGYYWMFGHESERWFRHNGEEWLIDNPNRLQSQKQGKLEWDWLMTSLVILIIIGVVVYSSALS